MARSRSTQPPKRPLTVMTCVASLLMLTAIIASMCGFGVFYFRVVAPKMQRIVPNPENYQGVANQLTELELEPLLGNPPRLSVGELHNQVVLLNFFGTWCRPCRAELQQIAELRQRFAGQDAFRLVAISYPPLGQGDDLQSLREETGALLKRLNLDLPVYWDPNNETRTAIDQFIPDAVHETSGVSLFPLTVLLDRQGVIRAIWIGYRSGMETEIEVYVDKVLSETEEEVER